MSRSTVHCEARQLLWLRRATAGVSLKSDKRLMLEIFSVTLAFDSTSHFDAQQHCWLWVYDSIACSLTLDRADNFHANQHRFYQVRAFTNKRKHTSSSPACKKHQHGNAQRWQMLQRAKVMIAVRLENTSVAAYKSYLYFSVQQLPVLQRAKNSSVAACKRFGCCNMQNYSLM